MSRQTAPYISIWDSLALTTLFEHEQIATQHAQKISNYITTRLYKDNAAIFLQETEMEWLHEINITNRAIEVVKEKCRLCTSKIVQTVESGDRSTTKLVIELWDGKKIETVIMRYGEVEIASYHGGDKTSSDTATINERPFKSNKRATVCISSQIGCAMKCTFCATGTMGMIGNLSAGEIIEQIVHANTVERIRNVVFMGMGEPLDNYDAVISAITEMTRCNRFGIAPNRVSLSTVGIPSKILALSNDAPKISFALSLHAPTQSLRAKIVPTGNSHPIEKILSAVQVYIEAQPTGRHVMIEYIMLYPLNTTLEVADQLGDLLSSFGDRVMINLIPYNETLAGAPHGYQTPPYEVTKAFADRVRTYGLKCLIRQTMGADAGSACGQLVVEKPKLEKKSIDLEDIGVASIPATSWRKKDSKRTSDKSIKENSKWAVEDFALVGLTILFATLISEHFLA